MNQSTNFLNYFINRAIVPYDWNYVENNTTKEEKPVSYSYILTFLVSLYIFSGVPDIDIICGMSMKAT
jgi:uncharacterized protein YycO